MDVGSVLAIITGASLGSFANMWSWRHDPEGKHNIKAARSVCDYCGRMLSWWENIPVLSYLWLKGYSRCCGKRLPFGYVVVEVLGGVYGWLGYRVWLSYGMDRGLETGLSGGLLILGLIVVSLLVVAYDLSYLMIPVVPVVIWVVLGMVWNVMISIGWQEVVLGMLASGGFLLGVYGVTKGRGMGLGDVFLVLGFSWFLGFKGTVAAMWLAFVLGSLTGIGLVFTGRVEKGMKGMIALGPFLVTAFWVTWAFQWWQGLIQ